MRILNRFSQENESQASTLVIISSKFNCYDVFRAQGWRVVPLIRLARLAVRLAQVCECSFNHTNPNSNLRIIHKPYWVVSLVYIFSSLSQSPLTVTAGSILLLKHLMRFVATGSEFITSVLVCLFSPLYQGVICDLIAGSQVEGWFISCLSHSRNRIFSSR